MVGRSKGRNTGPGSAHHAWLAGLPRIVECSVAPIAGGMRLSGRGDRWRGAGFPDGEFTVKDQPANIGEWHNRLVAVERLAARTILSSLPGYAVSIKPPVGGARSVVSVLRVAYAVSLDRHPATRSRFTAYQVDPANVAWTREGDDELFKQPFQDLTAGEKHSGNLEKRFELIIGEILDGLKNYIERPATKAYCTDLEKQLALQIDGLNRLYFTEGGKHARLHGFAPEGLRGDTAIEAEHRARLRSIKTLSQLRVSIELISVGLIRCALSPQRHTKRTMLALPFASHQAGDSD
jgi:hypothetical protein